MKNLKQTIYSLKLVFMILSLFQNCKQARLEKSIKKISSIIVERDKIKKYIDLKISHLSKTFYLSPNIISNSYIYDTYSLILQKYKNPKKFKTNNIPIKKIRQSIKNIKANYPVKSGNKIIRKPLSKDLKELLDLILENEKINKQIVDNAIDMKVKNK